VDLEATDAISAVPSNHGLGQGASTAEIASISVLVIAIHLPFSVMMHYSLEHPMTHVPHLAAL